MEVDVIVEVLQDYGWQMLTRARLQLQAVRWSRLLECLSSGHGGQPVLTPAMSWDQALRSRHSSATVRALVNALHNCHKATRDV